MRLLTRALLPLAALLAACTPYPYWPPYYYGYPGNIGVSWTFAGASCAQTPAVTQVRVSVPSDPAPIRPDTFTCLAGNPPGQLVVYNFAPGSYEVDLVGLDASGATIWSGSGTVTVIANTTVPITIDLQPAGGNNTIANLSWAFGTTVGSYFPPCTASSSSDPDRVDSVALYVDGATSAAQTYDCSQGTDGGQVSTPSLDAGQHSLQLVAYQAALPYPFAQSQPVTVTLSNSAPASESLTLDWLVGGVGVAWTYPSADACTSGAVASVTAGFLGSGSAGYTVAGWPCTTAVAPFERLPAVTGGRTYLLSVTAFGGPPSPILYSGTASVVIEPGHFYDGTSATLVTVPLN